MSCAAGDAGSCSNPFAFPVSRCNNLQPTIPLNRRLVVTSGELRHLKHGRIPSESPGFDATSHRLAVGLDRGEAISTVHCIGGYTDDCADRHFRRRRYRS
jgi:hypothetical protein